MKGERSMKVLKGLLSYWQSPRVKGSAAEKRNGFKKAKRANRGIAQTSTL